MPICNICDTEYRAYDSDAGTYKEYFCSDECAGKAEQPEICPVCHGEGVVSRIVDDKPMNCYYCGGSGEMKADDIKEDMF